MLRVLLVGLCLLGLASFVDAQCYTPQAAFSFQRSVFAAPACEVALSVPVAQQAVVQVPVVQRQVVYQQAAPVFFQQAAVVHAPVRAFAAVNYASSVAVQRAVVQQRVVVRQPVQVQRSVTRTRTIIR